MSDKSAFARLDPLFQPKSVAIIGASETPGKIGRLIMEQFLKMEFPILYPINPRGKDVLGIKAFPRITDVPGPVDMAMVLTPTDAALAAVKECAAKGVKLIVLTTSGFSEAGTKGRKIEQEMVRVAHEGGARIIGPNCVGIYSPAARLPFPLGQAREKGTVGLVSQSGFFADYLTLTTSANGIYFSKAVSCGNEADLNAIDFLEYLGEDPDTHMIVSYLEGIKDGRRFFDVARAVSRKKPIILWKGGVTEAGAAAAVSHTGALSGSRKVWEGALRQAGVISVKSFEEVVDCLYAFHLQPIPAGKRVGIVSGPGGMAVGATDTCLDLGLEVPPFSKQMQARLRKVIPRVGGSAGNPTDLSITSFVAPDVYRDAIRIVAGEEAIDMILVISATNGDQMRDMILDAMGGLRKPIVLTLMAGTTQSVARDVPVLLKAGIPVYTDAARAVKALSRLWEYARFRRRWALEEGRRHS